MCGLFGWCPGLTVSSDCCAAMWRRKQPGRSRTWSQARLPHQSGYSEGTHSVRLRMGQKSSPLAPLVSAHTCRRSEPPFRAIPFMRVLGENCEFDEYALHPSRLHVEPRIRILCGMACSADVCIVNRYTHGGSLGLHQVPPALYCASSRCTAMCTCASPPAGQRLHKRAQRAHASG